MLNARCLSQSLLGSWKRFVSILLALSAVSGCGGSSTSAPKSPQSKPKLAAAESPKARPRSFLFRDEVAQVVDIGIGRFLQRIRVEASLVGGKFQGWRIVALMPPDWWQGIDLEPGDIVTQVNGMPLERPDQAFAAFKGAKTASELRVNYIRGGEQRVLAYPIRDRGSNTRAPAPESRANAASAQ